jgi:hypothetical protein
MRILRTLALGALYACASMTLGLADPLNISSPLALDLTIARSGGTVIAFTLSPRSTITRALALACSTGHPVTVTLDRVDFEPVVARANEQSAALLRAAHCTVGYASHDLHLKLIDTGGVTYLSDTNFGNRAFVLAVTDPSIRSFLARTVSALRSGRTPSGDTVNTDAWAFGALKYTAQTLEALVLHDPGDGPVEMASESFGDSPLARELYDLARAHHSVRLLVAQSEARSDASEQQVLNALRNVGVQIRYDTTNEKELLAPRACWVGSANATLGTRQVQMQPDWGYVINQPASLCSALQERFERTWNASPTSF